MADRNILVVVDPMATEEQPVLERAAWLAEKASASIELFICDFDSDIEAGQVSTVWIEQPKAKDNLLKIHHQNLEKLAAPLRKRGLEVTVDVAWDHPLGEAIVRKTIASKPWIVAKDTHHHSLLRRTVLSNTDWHLIRGCPATLLLVKPREIAAKPKVLAAVDPLHEHDKPAELDEKIFKVASLVASKLGAELHLVHAFAVPVSLELPADVIQTIEEQHRKAMAAFLAAHKVGNENAHLLQGPPAECLIEITSDQNADFIVMGAVSRRGLDRLFIGSTANRVLDRLPCDLIIIKPEGFKPDLPHSD